MCGEITPAKFWQPQVRLTFNGSCDQSTQDRRKLEPMPTIASRHRQACPSGMTINPEISIGGIDVEATARRHKRRIVECRKRSSQECPQLCYPMIGYFDHLLTRVKRKAIPARMRNVGIEDDKIRRGKESRIGRLQVEDRVPSYLQDRGQVTYKECRPGTGGDDDLISKKGVPCTSAYPSHLMVFCDRGIGCLIGIQHDSFCLGKPNESSYHAATLHVPTLRLKSHRRRLLVSRRGTVARCSLL